MLVSWDWLSEYVALDVDHEDLALRFAMSGLNHESTEKVGDDWVIDLEVTSNRGDCLGHLGVAREAAVLLDKELQVPAVSFEGSGGSAASDLQIVNEFTEGCPDYTARLIRGVKVGPSPDWLVRRLQAIGLNSVNNVVDVTNYVMMECGQPLHAFDLKQIRGGKIVIRPAAAKESFLAIDHRTYELDPGMVVIADAERAVALGGVMGGADSEVSEQSTDLLIEAARFQPMAIRRAARKLKLHSPASFRFERSPDPHALDWASRRCCQLIQQLAGGVITEEWVRDGGLADPRDTIVFRLSQLSRILGIDVPSDRCVNILTALGCQVDQQADEGLLHVIPPTWRYDLTREVDLVEEIARIHGYEQIPENVTVPIGVASPRPKDVAMERARGVLSAHGIDEAMTPSVVPDSIDNCGSLWTEHSALSVDTPLLVGAKKLRRSIATSLMAARQFNQTQANQRAQLYEVASVFLPGKENELPQERCVLAIVTEAELREARGLVETLIEEIVGRGLAVNWQSTDNAMFAPGTGLAIHVDGKTIGYVGLANSGLLKQLDIDHEAAIAELIVDDLTELLWPVRTADAVSAFPSIQRDLNMIVDESLSWAELAETCRANAGQHVQAVRYQETYRDSKKDGAGKKRQLLTIVFQSHARTLTGEEVDNDVRNVIAACEKAHAAKLLG